MKRLVLVLLAACSTENPAAPSNDGIIALHAYSFHTANSETTSGGNVWISFETQHTTCRSLAMSGGCDVIECPGDPTIYGPHRAGTVTVTGAAVLISMTPSTEGLYGGFDASQEMFAGGTTLSVTATGDEVPAFTASLQAPGKAMITSPARPPNDTLTIDRRSGLPVSWTGGSGAMGVTVVGDGDLSRSVLCSFDASAGNGTVPAELLTMLPAGQGSVGFVTQSETRVSDGDWDISFRGSYNAVWPDDSAIQITATLQ